jgi:hypothetical protein
MKCFAEKLALVVDNLLICFMQVSHRLFELTNTLKIAFLPSRDNKRLTHNFIIGIALSAALYILSLMIVSIPAMLV